jgi:uncharacterized protein YjeT (DUF2065 family)
VNKKLAIFVGANLVLVVGGWFLLVSPQRHHQASAAQQLQQVQLEATRLVGGAATQATHAKQPAIRTSGLYRLAQAMPPSADEPDLLLALNHIAKASGVKVLGLSLQTPTPQIGYVVLPVSLTVDGTYGSVTRYLHTLRMLTGMRHGRLFARGRLISTVSVAMTPDGKGSTETATVSLNSYVFGAVDGIAPLSATSTTSTSTDTTTTTGG